MPLVGVLQSATVLGVGDLTEPAPLCEVLPLDAALEREWDCDAHLVCYYIPNQEADGWPRLRQSVLPRLRAAGGDALTTFFGIDVDNRVGVGLPHAGEKKPWGVDAGGTPELDIAMTALLDAADKGLWLAREWTAAYSTRNGYRLIYVLKEPMPVDEFEPWGRAIIRDFRAAGIQCDDLKDWTRLWRLPKVKRDGVFTSQESTFLLEMQPEMRLDHRRLVGVDPHTIRRAAPAEVRPLNQPMPDPSASKDLLYTTNPATGKVGKTDWMKEAIKRTKGRRCADVAFGAEGFGPPGDRHNVMFRAVGEAIGVLARMRGTTPELIFALFCDAGFKIDPATCTRDPFENLWTAVEYAWAKEAAKIREEETARQALSLGRQQVEDRILEGVREWCGDETLHGDEQSSRDALTGMLIACHGKHRFVMMPNGRFDSVGVDTPLLAARIREIGMDAAIPLTAEDLRTQVWKEVPGQTLLNKYGCVVKHAEGVVGGAGSYIRGFGTPAATLVVRLFGLRTDLVDTYDAEVDEWLHHLGGEFYYDLLDWIGHALDFPGGPICALSISGPPSIGKGMLAKGLAECIDTERLATSKDFGEYQSGLLNTSFLFLNEGIPQGRVGALRVADAFRQLVDGTTVDVNEKFLPRMQMYNPVRVLIASNDDSVIEQLAGEQDLTPDDQEALALRLLHIKAGPEAATYLRLKGGLRHTGRPGRRWIRSSDGHPSDYVLARHFLHLHKTRRPVPTGNRLLVQGKLDSEVVRRLATRSGRAPEVVEILLSMLNANQPVIEGLAVVDGKIYATTNGVQKHHKNLGDSRSRPLPVAAIAKVLDALAPQVGVRAPPLMTLPAPNGASIRARWREVDPKRLLHEAEEHGYRCDKLVRLLVPAPTETKIEG
jgi:hypothetical protein